MPEPVSQSNHWSGTGKLRGGRRGIWFFLTVLRVLGLRLTYVLLVPPAWRHGPRRAAEES